MEITITITKQELKEAIKSSDSFERFLDICECKYKLERIRAMCEAITFITSEVVYVLESEESSNA